MNIHIAGSRGIEFRENSQYDELKNLWWPQHDWASWSYMHDYRIPPSWFDNLMTHVPNRQIMIQAGGNCGQYVRQFAQRFETVYTFEPDPTNFLCLTMNCPDNVIKMQACLGNQRDFVNLNTTDDAGAIHVQGLGRVPCLRIDDFELPGCDLIQLDIEGFEYFALQGAEKTLAKFHPLLMIEWCEPWAERYRVNQKMLDEFLIKHGYEKILSHFSDIVYKHTA